jgi:hypothetical protein
VTASTHDPVAMRVVTFLGFASVIGILSAGALAYTALRYEGNSNAAVVIAVVGNLASAAVASLGSILASTGKAAPQPVNVVNPPTDPIPTADITATTTPATVEVHPDAPATSDL